KRFPSISRALLLYAGRSAGLRWASASSRSTSTGRGRWGCPSRARGRKTVPALAESLACLECLPIATLRRGLYRAGLHCTFYVAPVYLLFFLFGFDFTGKLRAAYTERPIGIIDLIDAVILGARHKSESTAGGSQNDLAFTAHRIIHELVEHDFRRRPNSQIG